MSAKNLSLFLTCLAASLTISLSLQSCSTDPAKNTSTPATLQKAPLLNSERIHRQFGSYAIDVLRQDENLRVSNLYSLDEGNKITRTLALVIFSKPVPAVIQQQHEKIIAGGSLGEVLKSHGWQLAKQITYRGVIPATANYSNLYAAMGDVHGEDLAILIYDLNVSQGKEWFTYASIAEVYHPDFLDIIQLRDLSGEPDSGNQQPSTYKQDILQLVEDEMTRF